MMHSTMIGLLMLQAAQAPTSNAAGIDPLFVFSGDWQVVDSDTGKVAIECKKAQRFAVSGDRRTIVLTEIGADNWTARYRVLRSEKSRILMYLEDEDRKTESGDPILWWAYFEGADRFRWRRYDWARDAVTAAQWRRCPRA